MLQIKLDKSHEVDIILRRGNSYKILMSVLDQEGNPYSFANHEIEMIIKENKSDDENLILLSEGSGITLNDGSIILELTEETTDLSQKNVFYQFKAKGPGFIKTWLHGNIIIE